MRKRSSSFVLFLVAALAGLTLSQPPFAFAGKKKAETAPAAVDGQAYVDYLKALNLAEQGSKPEALQILADSLRLQRAGNPAASIAFELLTELRTNSCLELRGQIIYSATTSRRIQLDDRLYRT